MYATQRKPIARCAAAGSRQPALGTPCGLQPTPQLSCAVHLCMLALAQAAARANGCRLLPLARRPSILYCAPGARPSLYDAEHLTTWLDVPECPADVRDHILDKLGRWMRQQAGQGGSESSLEGDLQSLYSTREGDLRSLRSLRSLLAGTTPGGLAFAEAVPFDAEAAFEGALEQGVAPWPFAQDAGPECWPFAHGGAAAGASHSARHQLMSASCSSRPGTTRPGTTHGCW